MVMPDSPSTNMREPVICLKRLSESELSSQTKRARTANKLRCNICGQWMDRVLSYGGHPEGSILEGNALEDDELAIDLGDDQLPQFKVSFFNFYDEENHLVSLDAGLIESNKCIYMSGYLKAITSEDPSTQGGVPLRDVGPIRQWWNGGFDGGTRNVIGVASDKAEYYLLAPATDFKPLWNDLQEKSFLAKVVIEFLEDARDNGLQIVYDDLVSKICQVDSEEDITLTPESLVKHSAFVLEQILSYDKALDDADVEALSLYPLLLSKCMTHLIKFSGLQTLKVKAQLPGQKSALVKKVESQKTTTTPFINKMFENLFKDQMEDLSSLQSNENPGPENDKNLSNGGPDLDAEEISFSDADVELMKSINCSDHFYDSARIKDVEYKCGDCVMIRPSDPCLPLCIGFIVNFYKDEADFPMAHIIWFSYAKDTVIGEIHDKREIFLLKECEDIPASAIEQKASVSWHRIPRDWNMLGGADRSPPPSCNGGESRSSFFYRFTYDEKNCRFEYIRKDVTEYRNAHGECDICITENPRETLQIISQSEVTIEGTQYFLGDAVFLSPATFDFSYSYSSAVQQTRTDAHEEAQSEKDEDKFPEKHRKSLSLKNMSSNKLCEPFCIGIICDIFKTNEENIRLKVRKFYRPENTYLMKYFMETALLRDLSLLYWSEDTEVVNAFAVKGKCIVRPKISIPMEANEWVRAGEHRFYFSEMYDSEAEQFVDLNGEALNYPTDLLGDAGDCNKLPNVGRPLRTLDVFAGCGGLSLGLHEAGVSQPCWAIENDKSASMAYKKNNPNCVVYEEDCNKILQAVLDGKLTICGQKLPQKGDVELLVGGPPCQGYSRLNRFNDRQASFFKNSLITTYLAYCDHYRPKYFILENVRNFVFYNNSSILKMCLSTLVRMGYQCTFAVLQAGMYGVPQSRRRAILLAAAPDESLPLYPKPLHSFDATSLAVHIDTKVFNQGWKDSAPYRAITVRDAISDLSQNELCQQSDGYLLYKSHPLSDFQKWMRRGSTKLTDHITKAMTPLTQARISLIPTAPGSDWRDLPNVRMKLSDGSFTNVLMYPYRHFRSGSDTRMRGVCRCVKSAKSLCDPTDRQSNTLIPWCLPHTANRNGQWQGLVGRLEWDSFFVTAVTNPDPIGKTGRVIHPEKHRLLTVRECARSQGFPDSYKFCGKVVDKYRQIGNAVPPPLGYAIGIEIRKALEASPNKE